MNLTDEAKRRLKVAQVNGLFEQDTEAGIIEIITEQEIVTECSSTASCCFDVDDIDWEKIDE